MGYTAQSCKELGTTERLSTHTIATQACFCLELEFMELKRVPTRGQKGTGGRISFSKYSAVNISAQSQAQCKTGVSSESASGAQRWRESRSPRELPASYSPVCVAQLLRHGERPPRPPGLLCLGLSWECHHSAFLISLHS